MAVSFGAVTFGVTAPDGYLQESSKEKAVELATIRDADGKTVKVLPKPRSTTTTTVKTKGEADLLAVPQDAFAGGTAKLTSSKVSQTNDDFSTSEATYTLFA
jgi:hypothetical protein